MQAKLACVAGVERGRGRGDLHALILFPFPFNTGHAGKGKMGKRLAKDKQELQVFSSPTEAKFETKIKCKPKI